MLQQLSILVLNAATLNDSADAWIWKPSNPFSVASTYKHLQTTILEQQQVTSHTIVKKFWHSEVPSKVLVFSWRHILNRLPTCDHLQRRNIQIAVPHNLCHFCRSHPEIAEHLFNSCERTKDISKAIFGCTTINNTDIAQHYNQFENLFSGQLNLKWKLMILHATVWSLWNARNDFLFREQTFDGAAIFETIGSFSWQWLIYKRKEKVPLFFSDWMTNCYDLDFEDHDASVIERRRREKEEIIFCLFFTSFYTS